mmetsp:Transcript_15020/g.20900  ORF Transcript_15020/g.20900 Transcript_15020/m.20900 type:complete len:122 (+) Transcript_15020:95-460(+)|eukprot:CAMPEP_0185268704 /NCGR_PEP_ID=MMETSP1359-20130426/37757_1 /TAXON_ID=552665 /ORGANISM="Bigelowiella longifila, Strain CCMP242" /LENGTH=121 /DNA_ID=CAMNT_0027859561 /DNA_START=51 /DNA_END=416 /DNA_ORIENTATION=+
MKTRRIPVARKALVSDCHGSQKLVWMQGIVVESGSDHLIIDDGSGVMRIVSTKLSKDDLRSIKVGDYVDATGNWKRKHSCLQAHQVTVSSDPNAELFWHIEMLDYNFFYKKKVHPLSVSKS